MKIKTKIVLWSLLISNFVVAMDTTILNTTGPLITKDIGGAGYYAWIFAIYTLLSTITIPIFGKLADRLGRKKSFLISVSLFTLASFLCGIAQTMPQLIIFRAIKGIAAGGVLPSAGIILGDLLTLKERGKYQGHFSLIWAVSAVLGPLLGSFIVEFSSWRWIFFINIPLGLFILACVYFYDETFEKIKRPINWLSAFLFSVATVSLLAVTIDISWIIYLLPVSIISLYFFYRSERKTTNPFLPLSMFKNFPILFFNVNTFLFFFALFGLESFIPYFLQEAQNSSVLMSGLVLSGISIGWIFSSYPSGKIVLNYGYKRPVLIGNVIITLSTIPFFFYSTDTPFYITFAILAIQGFCYGLIQTISSIGSYELSANEDKGFSSSLQSFSRNIGTAFSLGYMGTLVLKDPFYILYAAATLSIFSLVISMILIYSKRTISF
ncbi:MFS transporter [Bacillus mexicanus]|uniref:MFS transporter n=1 Tax=Bacillus mexicanus TaxID=2834415 RepID=UPI003D1AFF0A